jgi:uncharacterized membrane protein YjjP (DUF1212 family)
MKDLPWGPMLKWGAVYLVAVVALAIMASFSGLTDQLNSDWVSRVTAFGLLAVWGLVFARHRRR